MTALASDTRRLGDGPHCGCCGRRLSADRLTELMSTPGVFICSRCALWAARQSTHGPVVHLDPQVLGRRLRRRLRLAVASRGAMTPPVLYSSDLDRTASYYRSLGFVVTARGASGLAVRAGRVELRFRSGKLAPGVGEVFVEVPNAGKLWKRLRYRDVTGIGLVEESPSGWLEFVLTDADGNQLHVRGATVEN